MILNSKIILISVIFILIVILTIVFAPLPFNVVFANKIYVKFYDDEIKIDCEITDKNDVVKLKRLFDKSVSYHMDDFIGGVPSCGFSEDVSLTFQTGVIKVVLYPGCDTCGLFRIGNSRRYIALNGKEKIMFYEIVEKYGMTFPCI